MRHLYSVLPAFCIISVMALTGCSTTLSRHDPVALRAAPRPAFSLAMQQTGIIVAVSPVRQTMQIGGSIPTLLGAGISAVQDNQYAEEMRAALGDYDPGAVFMERLVQRITEHFDEPITQVAPQGTSAGHSNARSARDARMAGLRRTGYDMVLDLELRYGIYGPQGLLAVRIDGTLTDAHTGRVQWRNEAAWYSVDLYADMRWRDPMQRMTPNITAPRLTVAGDALSRWTPDNAAPFRTTFEQAAHDVAAAILTDLGLMESAEGLYTLGAYLTLNRKYAAAAEKFTRAIELTPDMPEAVNGLALTLAQNDQVDEAIELNIKLVEAQPDFVPAHYNLAWWYAVEKKAPDLARPHYERAIQLGAAPTRRLERAMQSAK